MSKREYEYTKHMPLADWLKDFANQNLNKGGSPFDDIRNMFDPDAVEKKVGELRDRVGLDLLIEKKATIRQVERSKERGEGTTKKWCVYPKDGGKALGCHDTKEDAQKQLSAIEISKGQSSNDFYIQEVKDDIFGGLGDNQPDYKFDPEQLEKGIRIELEHTNDPDKAEEITKDHLTETKDFKDEEGGKYYDELENMEDKIKDKLTKKQSMIANLILTANYLESKGLIKEAQEIDNIIAKYSKKEESVLEKNPKIKEAINNICNARGGHIDTPAIMQILESDRFGINFSQKDKKEIREYIKSQKNKIKVPEKDDGVEDLGVVVIKIDESDDDLI